MSSQELFDEILDPYESTFQQGKEDGRQAALQAGYNDGYQLGKLKSLEIGVELGYMSSICMMILQKKTGEERDQKSSSIDDGNSTLHSRQFKREELDLTIITTTDDHKTRNLEEKSILQQRKRKRIHDLLKSIEEFPKPETIFSIKERDQKDNHSRNSESNYNYMGDTDIVSFMQRLRAKFKAILVQHNMSHFRLKDVMDNANTGLRETSQQSDSNQAKEEIISRIDEW